jgi:photosystem II stability/assembly factor-like uncharacterized protein
MNKGQVRSAAARTWLVIGLGATAALVLVWNARRSRIDDRADAWQRPSASSASAAPAPSSLALPVTVYDPHLSHLSVAPDRRSVLVFGSEGTALRSTDDGQSWQSAAVPTQAFLTASVADAGTGAVVVVGTRGTILRSTDMGQSFATVRVDTKAGFRAIALAADGAQMLAVGEEGAAYVSSDGGQSFVPEATTRNDLLSLVIASPKRKRFIVGGENGALLLRDEGAGFRGLQTPAAGLIMALTALPDGKLFAGTQKGQILGSDDDGETWQELHPSAERKFVAGLVHDDAGSLLAARLPRGEVLLSSDRGKTFESHDTGKSGVAALTWLPGRGFAGIGDDNVVTSDVRGKKWASRSAPGLEEPLAMTIHPTSKTVLAVGASGLIARSTDHGQHYRIVRQNLGALLRSFADGSAAGCLVGVGRPGAIVHSFDAGKTWQRVPLDLSAEVELGSVVFEAKSRVLLAGGTSGTLLRSSDCGRRWAPIPATKKDVISLLVLSDSSVLALAETSRILRSTDAGATFVETEMEADATLRAVVATSASDVVAVGEAGRIYRSTNGGKSFQRVPSGTEGTLRALAYDAVHRALWAAGDAGTVLRSSDSGATWTKLSLPTEENLFVIGIHPDGSAVWIGGNRGTALRTVDQGARFSSIESHSTQTIRVIAFDPSAKEFVVAGAGGTLLRTVGGQQLVKVDSTLDGRIDAALFHAPSASMFLGGDRLIRLGG